jgi:hypothetical protein
MKERTAGTVTTWQLQRVIPHHISKPNMKERSSHAENAATRQLQRVISLNITID